MSFCSTPLPPTRHRPIHADRITSTTNTMNALDRLEDETADLILRLQLEDLAALDSNGDNTWGVDADVRLARRLFEAELRTYGRLRGFEGVDAAEGGSAEENHAVGGNTEENIAVVNTADVNAANVVAAVETPDNETAADVTADDENVANETTVDEITANHNGVNETTLDEDSTSETTADEITAKGTTAHEANVEGIIADQDGEDQASEEVNKHIYIPHVECTACGDSFPNDDSYTAPCSHVYHNGCLAKLLSEAMTDETLYPPRCCSQNMDVDSALKYLPDGLATEFQAKREELDDDSRTYCHVPTCSAYIPAGRKTENLGRCPKCQEATCIICNGAPHQDRDCPEDEGTKTILDTARQSGWQQCRTCGRVIERNTGCYHIT